MKWQLIRTADVLDSHLNKFSSWRIGGYTVNKWLFINSVVLHSGATEGSVWRPSRRRKLKADGVNGIPTANVPGLVEEELKRPSENVTILGKVKRLPFCQLFLNVCNLYCMGEYFKYLNDRYIYGFKKSVLLFNLNPNTSYIDWDKAKFYYTSSPSGGGRYCTGKKVKYRHCNTKVITELMFSVWEKVTITFYNILHQGDRHFVKQANQNMYIFFTFCLYVLSTYCYVWGIHIVFRKKASG